MSVDPMVQLLAEDANAYTPLGPKDVRVETKRFVLWMGAGEHHGWNVAQRFRIDAGGVEAAVEEVHELVRWRGRKACTWEVSSAATPDDLVDRLLELGLARDREPHAVGMVLTEEPPPAPAGVVTRAAESVADYEAAARIAAIAFEIPEEATAELVAGAAEQQATEAGSGSRTYVAFVDGQPVARATATFTPWGVILFGGATLPEARSRGAYRALVRARWDDAVARGTPALVTHAGAMSRPILERSGFRPVSEIQILLDEFDT